MYRVDYIFKSKMFDGCIKAVIGILEKGDYGTQ